MSSEVERILEHHGVKGMRWGVRTKSSSRKESSDYKKAAPLRKRPVSELTNRQLKIANERGNLEQNFKRMNPSTAAKGKAAAAGILATATMAATAYNLIKSPAGQALINKGKSFVQKHA